MRTLASGLLNYGEQGVSHKKPTWDVPNCFVLHMRIAHSVWSNGQSPICGAVKQQKQHILTLVIAVTTAPIGVTTSC